MVTLLDCLYADSSWPMYFCLGVGTVGMQYSSVSGRNWSSLQNDIQNPFVTEHQHPQKL